MKARPQSEKLRGTHASWQKPCRMVGQAMHALTHIHQVQDCCTLLQSHCDQGAEAAACYREAGSRCLP